MIHPEIFCKQPFSHWTCSYDVQYLLRQGTVCMVPSKHIEPFPIMYFNAYFWSLSTKFVFRWFVFVLYINHTAFFVFFRFIVLSFRDGYSLSDLFLVEGRAKQLVFADIHVILSIVYSCHIYNQCTYPFCFMYSYKMLGFLYTLWNFNFFFIQIKWVKF